MSDTSFQRTQLSNGVRVVSERIPHVRSVSIGAWLLVGSRDESIQTNGLSHFIEHMLFKGTKTRHAFEIAESLESVGGHLNAFTGKELTCYYGHILDEHLPIAIDILADILLNSVFDEEEIVKEKQVVLEELSTLEETPEEIIHDHFIEGLFPQHPLGYPTIGKRDTISNFRRPHILNYLSTKYTGDRMVIAAAGNVDHSELVKLTEHFFSQFAQADYVPYAPPSALPSGRNVIENGAIQAHVCLGTQGYAYDNPKKFGLLVLNTLLGSGMSSRLFQNIREKRGLAYSIYSYIDFLVDTGLFGVYIGTDKNKVDDSLDLIMQELQDLAQNPISEAELLRTKSQLKGNLMLGLESTASRMNRLAKMELYLKDYFSLDHTLNEIERVDVGAVLDVANELFTENRLYCTILKPKLESSFEEAERL